MTKKNDILEVGLIYRRQRALKAIYYLAIDIDLVMNHEGRLFRPGPVLATLVPQRTLTAQDLADQWGTTIPALDEMTRKYFRLPPKTLSSYGRSSPIKERDRLPPIRIVRAVHGTPEN